MLRYCANIHNYGSSKIHNGFLKSSHPNQHFIDFLRDQCNIFLQELVWLPILIHWFIQDLQYCILPSLVTPFQERFMLKARDRGSGEETTENFPLINCSIFITLVDLDFSPDPESFECLNGVWHPSSRINDYRIHTSKCSLSLSLSLSLSFSHSLSVSHQYQMRPQPKNIWYSAVF